MAIGASRALLLSLPWADYIFPSPKIGALAAYARSHGHSVDACHAHLEAAAIIGLDQYSRVVVKRIGEAYSASLLFPDRRIQILHSLSNSRREDSRIARSLRSALRNIYESIPWHSYHIVGFTVDLDQIFASLVMAKWIKQEHPHIKVVFGGHCASDHLGAAILKCFPQVDWCINGEGEIPFTRLLSCLVSKTNSFEQTVPGLIFRIDNGINMNPRTQLPTLDGLPDPDFDHYFQTLENHPLLSGRGIDCNITIEGGRGCTHRCAFCAFITLLHGYRARPSIEVAAQMERMSRRYRMTRFLFTDLRTQPENDKALFKEILRQGRDYLISYEFRADIGKPLLALMRSAGVTTGQIGIEAISSSLLRKMNKQTRFIENLQAMKFCTEMEIDHISNLMLGFPTETQKDIDESTRNIDYALAYRPPVHYCRFIVLDRSLVDTNRERFGVSDVQNDPFFSNLLPKELRDKMLFLEKSHRRRYPRPRYTKLLKRYRSWGIRYNEARKNGERPLQYFDCGDFLRIEDRREENLDITLDGAIREIYLFCDEIRSFDKIRRRFPKVPEKELRSALRKLFKLKVMYTEEDDWLSLAIHASPENRRHLPFL